MRSFFLPGANKYTRDGSVGFLYQFSGRGCSTFRQDPFVRFQKPVEPSAAFAGGHGRGFFHRQSFRLGRHPGHAPGAGRPLFGARCGACGDSHAFRDGLSGFLSRTGGSADRFGEDEGTPHCPAGGCLAQFGGRDRLSGAGRLPTASHPGMRVAPAGSAG